MYTIGNYHHYGITPEHVFDLPCLDSHKSFYGKAKIIETKKGMYLQSYNTLVFFVSYGGTFMRLWDGYSFTTMRHVNSFLNYCKVNAGGKAFWDSLVTNKEYNLQEVC